MRITKRIFALLLAVALSASVLCACNQASSPDETGSSAPTGATTPAATTPENELPADPPATPPKKITSVHVTYGDSAIEGFAAAELKWYFTKKSVALSNDGFGVALKIDAALAKPNGYRITADENGVVITGGNERGLAYALYAFLEKYLGVHVYSADTVVIEEGDVMIGGGLLAVYEPTFEVLRDPWAPIEKLPEKDGGSVIETGSTKTLSLSTITGNGSVQPCLTDPESLPKAVTVVKNYLRVVSGVDTLRFAPSTEYDLYCECERCAAVHEVEGSPAGVYVRFLNELTKALSEEYPDLKYELVTRAYLKTAPAVTKPADNITIYFDMNKCHVSHPITDTSCPEAVAFADTVRSWSAICDTVYVEYPLTATTDYIPVFANLGSLYQNISFFAACGVDRITFTGNLACPAGDFGELRMYLVSRLLQDPTMSEEECYAHMDDFLQAFYGEGWTYIRKFIDKTVELAADGHQTPDGSHFDAITEEEYLANEEAFDEWWNSAEALAGDRLAFVKRSRYQWRYVKLCLHPNEEEARLLIAENASSFNERVAWRNSQWNVDIEKTDFTLPPTEWVYKS